MRLPLLLSACFMALAACSPAPTAVSAPSSPSARASASPAASPAASGLPAASASAGADFQAVRRFESDSYVATLDGQPLTISTTVDRVVPATTTITALTLGVTPPAGIPQGGGQVVMSISGKDGKTAAMPGFKTSDLGQVGFQLFVGNGTLRPAVYHAKGTPAVATYTVEGGKFSATIEADVANPLDFAGKEPVRKFTLKIDGLVF